MLVYYKKIKFLQIFIMDACRHLLSTDQMTLLLIYLALIIRYL